MALFNGLDKKISAFGQDALRKTKDLSESVKLSGMIREEIEKQQELFRQLGQRIYKSGRTYEELDLQNLIMEIRASEDKLAQYQTQLKQLKKMIKCPSCNADIPADAVFCNKCGARIQQETQEIFQTENPALRCKNCGASLEEGQLFCVSCGTKVGIEESVPAAEAVAPEQTVPTKTSQWERPAEAREEVMEEAEATKEEGSSEIVGEVEQGYCPACNNAVKAGQAFCTRCGAKLE